MDELTRHLGISPLGAVSVVVSSTVMYAALSLVLRLWGRRLNASASVATLVLVTLIGSIAARATLGDSPTLMGGLVAIGTLLLLEQLFGRWAVALPWQSRWGRSAVVLMVGDELRMRPLRQHGMSEHHLWSQLRQHGVTSRADIGLVILEPRGAMTVVPNGRPLDRSLFEGVEGLEEVPDEFFGRPSAD